MKTEEMTKQNVKIVVKLAVLFWKIQVFQCLPVAGDAEQELGPPPSVDEAMEKLAFSSTGMQNGTIFM